MLETDMNGTGTPEAPPPPRGPDGTGSIGVGKENNQYRTDLPLRHMLDREIEQLKNNQREELTADDAVRRGVRQSKTERQQQGGQEVESRPDSAPLLESKQVREIASFIRRNDDMGLVRVALGDFRRYIEGAKQLIVDKDGDEKYNEYLARVDEMRDLNDLEDIRKRVNKLAPLLASFYKAAEKKGQKTDIRSLEDLAEFVMDGVDDDWKPGGKYEIMDDVGDLHPEHFLAWVRSRVWWYHDLNTDTPISLMKDIQVGTEYRHITLSEILDNVKYWRTRQYVAAQVGNIEVVDANGYPVPELDANGQPVLLRDKDGKPIQERDENNVLKVDAEGQPIYKQKPRIERRLVTTYDYKKKEEYEKLKEHVLYEVWLYEQSHNWDTQYRTSMGNIGELSKVLLQAHYNNVMTKDHTRLVKLLMLPATTGDETSIVKEMMGVKEGEEQKTQGLVGKMIRRTLLTNFYLSDELMVNQVLGPEGVKEFYRGIIKKLFEADITEMKNAKKQAVSEEDQKDVKVDIFGEDRDLFLRKISEKHRISPADFGLMDTDGKQFTLRSMKYFLDNSENKGWSEIGFDPEKEVYHSYSILNFFNNNKRPRGIIDAVRAGIRDGVVKAEGVEDPSLFEHDIKYADGLATSMVYWMGISARNDTEGIAFDKWSAVVNTRVTRERQAKGRGAYGIPDNIPGMQKLGITFLEALKVKGEGEHAWNKSFLEVLQGGEGENVDLSTFKKFDFVDSAQRQFFIEHLANGFKLAEFLDKHGMNFTSLLKTDIHGRLIIDLDKADDAIMDGVWHDLRYAFDQPEFDWNKKIRGWHKEGGKLVFTTRSLREWMFNGELRNMGMYERDLFSVDKDKKVARDAFAYLISKEMQWHRSWRGGPERWGLDHIELIKAYFRGLPMGLEEKKLSGNRSEVIIGKSFFSEGEWEGKIAKLGGVTMGALWRERIAMDTGGGFFEGFSEMVKEFVKVAGQDVK